MLENTIINEKNKQKVHQDHKIKRGELLCLMRFGFHFHLELYVIHSFAGALYRLALQHMLSILRHVGSPDVYKNREYPTVDLNLPLFKFNTALPPMPPVMETDRKISLIAT